LSNTHQNSVCIKVILQERLPLSKLPLVFPILLHNNHRSHISLPPPPVKKREEGEQMSRLAPLSEEPINEDEEYSTNCSKKKVHSWRNWLKTHFHLVFNKRSDLKVLLSVLGCPLFPVSIHSKSPVNEVCHARECVKLCFFRFLWHIRK
jgi:hypothetical protein